MAETLLGACCCRRPVSTCIKLSAIHSNHKASEAPSLNTRNCTHVYREAALTAELAKLKRALTAAESEKQSAEQAAAAAEGMAQRERAKLQVRRGSGGGALAPLPSLMGRDLNQLA